MLKHRIIPVLLFKETGLFKGKRFSADRTVGPVMPAVQVYERRQVDELILLDIGATPYDHPRAPRPPDFDLIAEIAEHCYMPLTIGGGIKRLQNVTRILRCGADKVIITTKAVRDPAFVKKVSEKVGSQSVVVGIDVKDGKVTHRCGKGLTDCDPAYYAEHMEKLGAGEIFLQNIDHDGMMEGYDVELIAKVASAVNIPVIACGGAGKPGHFADAIDAGAHACAAASIFQFTDTTPADVAGWLADRGYPMRLQRQAS